MKYEKLFKYIIKRADVRELENILSALHHLTNLSPAGLVIFNEVMKKAFDKELHPAKVKDVLTKAKFELATHIYF